ncbi:hypothetical protein CI102_14152 [Trichoderma harzianum]|uniref:Uncharacterized protein n=1 Tax=Trichoderma harzianum CBS 226.95 TaxID=983964 RepID=A0A2T4A2L9_TRIHA|nr:hypothetical protein M431DRAFT_239349 [Trichoderma harzianum CBS 226.95]PKK41008.1 hypothetical protein CI102_14152 [Trichoderma harzianum]PTB51312.1 hypothetical protein M431DRAFT_239349 [Trichoderma harzianum CBS 226.95]
MMAKSPIYGHFQGGGGRGLYTENPQRLTGFIGSQGIFLTLFFKILLLINSYFFFFSPSVWDAAALWGVLGTAYVSVRRDDRRRLSAGAAFTMCTCCELDDSRGVFVLSKMGGGLGLAGPKYRTVMLMLCVCRASRALLCSPIIHDRLHDDTHRKNS